MSNIYSRYQEEIVPKMMQEFDIKNKLAVPKIEKIVLNMGLSEAKENKEIIAKASEQLATITGQKPKITKAKKAVSSFKLLQNN